MKGPGETLPTTRRIPALQHRLAVVTMLYQDHEWARLWYAHYIQHVDSPSDLKVILHGPDPILEEIFAGCSLIHVPRDAEDPYFEEHRLQLTHDLVRGLLAYYSAVVMVDIDEFLCVDPAAEQKLSAYFAQKTQQETVRSGLGVELITGPDGPRQVDLTQPILKQAQYGVACSNYSKPVVFFKYFLGGNHHRITGVPWVIDCNLIIFHLRFIDLRRTRQYIRSRLGYFDAQKSADGVGSSGGWRNPRAEFKQIKTIIQEGNPKELTRDNRVRIAQRFLTHFQQKGYVGRKMSGLLTIPKTFYEVL